MSETEFLLITIVLQLINLYLIFFEETVQTKKILFLIQIYLLLSP